MVAVPGGEGRALPAEHQEHREQRLRHLHLHLAPRSDQQHCRRGGHFDVSAADRAAGAAQAAPGGQQAGPAGALRVPRWLLAGRRPERHLSGLRQLVIADADLPCHPVSASGAGRPAPQPDRAEHLGMGAGGVQMPVGLQADRTGAAGL